MKEYNDVAVFNKYNCLVKLPKKALAPVLPYLVLTEDEVRFYQQCDDAGYSPLPIIMMEGIVAYPGTTKTHGLTIVQRVGHEFRLYANCVTLTIILKEGGAVSLNSGQAYSLMLDPWYDKLPEG